MPRDILVVEDSADDVLFLTRALKKAGAHNPLQVVEDGIEALDFLAGRNRYASRANQPLPGLIFLDLKLPGVPGLDVLRNLRSETRTRSTIVIVLTSSDHPTDVRNAYSFGANSFLTKPSNPDDLTELIKVVVEYWLKWNVADLQGDARSLGP